MDRACFTLLVALVGTGLAAVPSAAQQWGPLGVPVCGDSCRDHNFRAIADGAGGVFVAWSDYRYLYDTDDDAFAQRITAAGKVAPGWPPCGLPVCVLPGAQNPSALALDGQGGVLIAWSDWRNVNLGTQPDVYVQRIHGDGMIAQGWAANGVPATRGPDYQTNPDIAPDGQGGAYVAWEDWRSYPATQATDVYAQHLTATGEPAPGWPADGLGVCTDPAPQGGASVLSDGAGGAVVVWLDARRGGYTSDKIDVYAQHQFADGSVAPGWARDGVPVVMGRTKAHVAPDGAGGFYVGCSTVNSTGADLEYFVQRFTFSGGRASGWPDGGVRVCAAVGVGSRDGLRVAPDGLGGLLLTWQDSRVGAYEVYAARVLPDGSLAPGWTADGVRLSDPTAPGNEMTPSIASDGAGGGYIAWRREDYTGDPNFVQHLTAAGTVAPGWPQYGERLSPTSSQFDPRVVEDGLGGAIVVWDERALVRQGVYAQRYGPDGPTPVLVSLASAVAYPGRVVISWQVMGAAGVEAAAYRRTAASGWERLGAPSPDGADRLRYEDRTVAPGARYAYRLGYLEQGLEHFSAEAWVEVPALRLALEGLRPNPAVGELMASFTLPSAAPARLQLLDVTGRVWLAREVGSLGAGSHLVRLSGDVAVPAGMYWLRLTQSGRSLLARGVVVR